MVSVTLLAFVINPFWIFFVHALIYWIVIGRMINIIK